jgi:hypothetical protein
MPIPETQATLKSFFETGDKPTQAQFAELIDTMFALYQLTQTAANAAVATANLALAAAGVTLVSAPGATTAPVADQKLNVASITYLGIPLGFYRFRITFTTPYVNLRHIPVVLNNLTKLTPSNAGYIDVEVQNNGSRWDLVVFGQQ